MAERLTDDHFRDLHATTLTNLTPGALGRLQTEGMRARRSEADLTERLRIAEEALVEVEEVLNLSDPDGRRLAIRAPEDLPVAVLCETWGYGAVMDSAARLWRLKPLHSGGDLAAHTHGAAAGTVQDTLAQVRAALAAIRGGK